MRELWLRNWLTVLLSNHKMALSGLSFTKWPAAAVLDNLKSLLITFLAISDQYATFFLNNLFTNWPFLIKLWSTEAFSSDFLWLFYKMAGDGHFGWPATAILDDQKSLSIAFLAISDQYPTFIFFGNVSPNDLRQPFWMTENHFRSHFSPFQINTQLLFFQIFFHKMGAGGHFGWPKITFDRISRHFRSIRNFYR